MSGSVWMLGTLLFADAAGEAPVLISDDVPAAEKSGGDADSKGDSLPAGETEEDTPEESEVKK